MTSSWFSFCIVIVGLTESLRCFGGVVVGMELSLEDEVASMEVSVIGLESVVVVVVEGESFLSFFPLPLLTFFICRYGLNSSLNL